MSTATIPAPVQAGGDLVQDREVNTALKVETPENVILEYQLAGPSVRFAAFVIDFLVRMAVLFAIGVFLACAGISVLGGGSLGLFFIAFFVVDWFYYVANEWYFRGKSVGKHAMGIRVIQQSGYPISFFSSCLRNILRAADAMPFSLYGVGFLTMLLTKKGQRLGDLAAKTVVITERRVELPREPIILERIQPLPREEIVSSFVPNEKTLAMIEQFLSRRFVLTHERGHALAAVLASKLAEKLNFQGDSKLVQQYPMAFLARVYVTFLKRTDDAESEFAGGDFREAEPVSPRRRSRARSF